MRKEDIRKHEMRHSTTKGKVMRKWGKKEEMRPERRAVTKRDKIKTRQKQRDEKIRDEK